MLTLSPRDRAMLNGDFGAGVALAMRIVAATARVMDARALIDITSAHIDGCLYHGAASLDFVERFVASGAKVSVPTTLNVGSLDLIHPELFRGDAELARAGTRLMQAHVELGCEASFTCAPYQLRHRPKLGDQIAWAESNAIVFANSVLGARTSRYGDFLDLAAAITGRVPHAGLHVTENRAARVVIEAPDVSASPHRDAHFAALGFVLGGEVGATVAAITGLPADTTEDELKALGAAAASSGSVALFHAVGITPEAATLDAALQGRAPERTLRVSAADLAAVRARWSRARPGDALAAVSLGTPHFSVEEFRTLAALFDRHEGKPRSDFYVNTSRFVLWQLEQDGIAQTLGERGVQIVVDTCTYITPVMKQVTGLVMTNSGKWAHYAPANIGVTVAFGSMSECVRSAFEGQVWFDESI
ncbi:MULTISPECIES: aconitase X catalytic domain-containing protein [unclassified Caballeronia]|uniref:aconitase X catalytic domain-containing protein n=1 Tax=unclassified Caballeronia TaxID=2646786 RepID=UPI00285E30BC|nr:MULTISPECIES: aconitase X catalytic domain-containing protein [unclassified Caballeronia]MDR5816214.1 aconitase X catalytic domain-containing protein [Caballeronia sp. LZ033]MDR5880941.1 aconitase X catalytic domain-containing protein [Caballeronia sp. LZ032]